MNMMKSANNQICKRKHNGLLMVFSQKENDPKLFILQRYKT